MPAPTGFTTCAPKEEPLEIIAGTAINNNAIIIPEGCAHGFQTLEDDSELVYIHSKNWIPEYEFGIRFDDPKLKISWPLNNVYLSERDKNLPFI